MFCINKQPPPGRDQQGNLPSPLFTTSKRLSRSRNLEIFWDLNFSDANTATPESCCQSKLKLTWNFANIRNKVPPHLYILYLILMKLTSKELLEAFTFLEIWSWIQRKKISLELIRNGKETLWFLMAMILRYNCEILWICWVTPLSTQNNISKFHILRQIPPKHHGVLERKNTTLFSMA